MFHPKPRLFRNRPNDMDELIALWSQLDPITARMLCQHILICGQTGSGKSSGSGDFLLRALVRHRNTGGVIFAAKPEDKAYVQRVFHEERTLDDLYILEPGGEHRMNVLEYERQSGADARDLTQACMLFKETLTRTESGSGGGGNDNAAYFVAQERMMLHHAIVVLLLATGRIDPWALHCFISGAAISLDELKDDTWKKDYHHTILQAAKSNVIPSGQQDFMLAEQYWTFQLPRMNERTRTSIEAGVFATLFAMNTGVARELLATTTTISPATIELCKWILVNAPITTGDVTNAVINAAVKYSVQRHILKRTAKPGDPLLCLFADEFQKIATSYDAGFLAEARSHKGSLIALTQSVHALYANLHGKGGEHQTNALLTNFGHVIVHTVGDFQTAKNWSDVLGMRREPFISVSRQPKGEELFDLLMGRSDASASWSERYEPVCQPAVFLSRLRCGGPPDNMVDGVIIRSGTPFNASNENYLITSFRQR